MSSRSVLCLGILVADIFVPPLEHLPEAGELVATGEFLVQPGGCAANVALGLAALGVPAAVSGCVGDDVFGELVVRELQGHGVETNAVVRRSGTHTSTTVILPVVGDDRRYVHTFGANAAFGAGDLSEDALAAAEVLYVGGYLMLPELRQESLVETLVTARRHGTTVILDVAVPAGMKSPVSALQALLPLADYFVPNSDEARVITGKSEPRRQADRLMALGAQRVLIKLGEHGTYVRDGAVEFEMPAPEVEAIEPSGAGDAFAAGLIVGILEHWDLPRMVRFANVTGASACTALGAWNGVFSRAQSEEFLARHPLASRSPVAA
ncbi:MAG TPA: sugar kinase [Solirubrobacteraceae bacterium]|nr:sugar kinase [Solirubrobacteraceae bacterium]